MSILYQPKFKLHGAGTFLPFGSPSSALSVAVTGLSPSTSYDFQVDATNGFGTASSTVINASTTAVDGTAPPGSVAGSQTTGSPPTNVVTRSYTDQPGTNACVWNTPLGAGATWGVAGDADTQSARSGGFINSTSNFGAVIWVSQSASDPLIRFTGTGADYDNGTNGTKFDITAHCVVGSYASGPFPGDNQYAFIDTTSFPGIYFHFAPLAIQSLAAGSGPYNAFFGGSDDAMSDTFATDWETHHANFVQGAGLIRAYDIDPTKNLARIPGTSLTAIQHVLRYAHAPSSLKANANPANSDYPNGPLLPNSWPQYYQDFQGGGTPENTYGGNLVYGTLLGIPSNVAMPSGLTTSGQQIWWTLQHYGSITRDAAGGGYHLYADQNVSQTWIDNANKDLGSIVQFLCPMRNQHQGGQSFSTNPMNGPGARLDVGPPPLAPLPGSIPPSSEPIISGPASGSVLTSGTLAITGLTITDTAASTKTVWSSTDKSANYALTNANLTATSGAADVTGGEGIRSQASRSTGRLYFEITLNGTMSGLLAVGLVNSSFVLNSGGGMGGDANSFGWYPVTNPGASTAASGYINNVLLTLGAATETDVKGAVVSFAVDLSNKQVWVTSPGMRAVVGAGAWNNSTSSNPSTLTGPLSLATLAAGPYFISTTEGVSGTTTTLNTGASAFSVAVPTGFAAWDGPISLILTTTGGSLATTFGGVAASGSGTATVTFAGSITQAQQALTNLVLTAPSAVTSVNVKIQAFDAVGGGNSITIPVSVVAQRAPSAPTSLIVTSVTVSSASLSWVASTIGLPVPTYQPQFRISGSSTYTAFGAKVTGTSVTITGLTASTNYDFTIVAVNTAGSATSAVATATTSSSTAVIPIAPTGLVITP